MKTITQLPYKATTGLAAVAIALAGCGAGDEKPEKAAPKVVKLRVDAPGTVTGKVARIEGVVKPASAELTLDGDQVSVAGDGRFSERVKLAHKGGNPFTINARKRGYRGDSEELTIVRKLTRREIAAARARERRRRIAAAQRRERERQAAIQRKAQKRQSFIASAQTIPYNQLHKNPEKYAGTKVKYTGQIFQIQEAGDAGGILLLAVTDQGYGIWDDNVWVDYNSPIQGAEEDIITVYGVVKGSKSYETQVGGETYVPQIQARYIEE